MIRFVLNRSEVTTDAAAGAVLLDVLRGEFGLHATKEGCREGDCGACSVLVGQRYPDGVRYRTAGSCLLPVGALQGVHIVTLEGLNEGELSLVQQAIVDEGATQCGFCTPGIIIALTGFLLSSDALSLDDAYAAVEGNICRCTGYTSVRRAVQRLVERIALQEGNGVFRVEALVAAGQLPSYFLEVSEWLDGLPAVSSPDAAEGVAVTVAGGTDLFVQQAAALRSRPLRFIGDEPEWRGIERRDDHIAIGAAVTVEELKQSPIMRCIFPVWDRALQLVSSTLIRNRATVGGNIVNASPIGDLTILLLAMDAALRIFSPKGERCVSLDGFYQGYKQFDLREGEWIGEVILPEPPAEEVLSFEKVSRREHLDIASVNTAMSIEVSEGCISKARLSAGGV
ncbi:MAG: 2Fe-2S iron-sulfur cluster binding domain-containing protein, partial [Verrucomicrobia bacterium]|nr:2Fe-2S iron-sulfur cluster binding domain-containing protein [Verrucomicrobiota bacterium]